MKAHLEANVVEAGVRDNALGVGWTALGLSLSVLLLFVLVLQLCVVVSILLRLQLPIIVSQIRTLASALNKEPSQKYSLQFCFAL